MKNRSIFSKIVAISIALLLVIGILPLASFATSYENNPDNNIGIYDWYYVETYEVVSIVPTESGWYNISTDNSCDTNIDPIIYLYDEYFNLIDYNDDYFGLNSLINCYLEAGETYYVECVDWRGNFGYVFICIDLDSDYAETMAPGSSFAISTGDCICIVPDISGWYSISTDNSCDTNIDPIIYLYDEYFNLIDYNDDFYGLNSLINCYLEAGETYYVECIDYRGNYGEILVYINWESAFESTDNNYDDDNYYDDDNNDYEINSFFWEEFTADYSGWYCVYTCHDEDYLDPVFEIYDDTGWYIDGSDDSDVVGNNDGYIEIYFDEGCTYYISVWDYHGVEGNIYLCVEYLYD